MLPSRQMRVGEPLLQGSAAGDLTWPIRRATTLFTTAEAVVDSDRRLDYRELSDRIASLAGVLATSVVHEGGRVGFVGANSLA